ncbi:hypothetical protein U1Q18_018967 [Sarracenia purpurea var. burkii]
MLASPQSQDRSSDLGSSVPIYIECWFRLMLDLRSCGARSASKSPKSAAKPGSTGFLGQIRLVIEFDLAGPATRIT